jgi:hypothetical protein
MKYILIITISLFSLHISAQDNTENRFIVNDKINALIAQRADCIAKNKQTLKYYHIQLYNGQNMGSARGVKSKFNTLFPGVYSIIEWESPEFKVWAGEYENKLSADQALIRIKKEFPNAFIVNPKK